MSSHIQVTEEDRQAAREYLEARARYEASDAEAKAWYIWRMSEPPTPITRLGRFPLARPLKPLT